MALKKSQLYSSLWQSCDELRGGMDASQYKDYVLTLLFMKYVSDKYASDSYALIEVPAGGGFADMANLKGDKEIDDKINKIIGRLAEANDLKGVIDQADFNDESKLGTGKEMQDRLSKLVAIFEGLDFRANLAEDMLERFADLPLLNAYDVYQRLMDYWDEVMQDDMYLVAADGWGEAAKPRGIVEDKDKKIKETPDLTIKRRKYKMDLIPPHLIVARYFTNEQVEVETLHAKQEAAARVLEEFVEEHTGEEGLLEDAVNDKGKVSH